MGCILGDKGMFVFVICFIVGLAVLLGNFAYEGWSTNQGQDICNEQGQGEFVSYGESKDIVRCTGVLDRQTVSGGKTIEIIPS